MHVPPGNDNDVIAGPEGMKDTWHETGSKQRPPGKKNLVLAACALILLLVCIGFSAYPVLFPEQGVKELPEYNTTYQHIRIIEHRNVTDPSYEQLLAFLANDTTDSLYYEDPNFTCSDFAAMLHNNAEAQGIRCAIVTIELNTTDYLEDRDSITIRSPDGTEETTKFKRVLATDNIIRGHAFNAFNTTDRGLIYVDNTGITRESRLSGMTSYDMAAYVSTGKEYGCIALIQATSFDYAAYEDKRVRFKVYEKEWEDYSSRIDTYNRDLDEYNILLQHYVRDKETLDREAIQYISELEAYNELLKEYEDALKSIEEESGKYDQELNEAMPLNVSEKSRFGSWLMDMTNRRASLSPPPGKERLDTWRQSLMNRASEIERRHFDLEKMEKMLDIRHNALIERRQELLHREEGRWIITEPMGIVQKINTYW